MLRRSVPLLLLFSACAPTVEDDDSSTPRRRGQSAEECGNDEREGDEVCDGDDLAGDTCVTKNFSGGTLKCRNDCSGFNTTSCTGTCTPSCGARQCGNDPVCGTSCGTCADGETCATDGQCEAEVSADGPTFLSFLTNVTTYKSSGTLIFTAVLTDSQGIDDLIGGTLTTPDGGASYGAFATSAAEGSYTLSLTWSAINEVSPINVPEAGGDRVFRAVFYDESGNSSSRTLTVTLQCAGAGYSACSGYCVDLDSDESNCGVCGRTVYSEGGEYCYGGSAVCDHGYSMCGGACVRYDHSTENCGICGHSCNEFGAIGETAYCSDGTCGGHFSSTSRVSCYALCATKSMICVDGNNYAKFGFSEYWLSTCATVPPTTYDAEEFTSMDCACKESIASTCDPAYCNSDTACGSDGCGGICGVCAEGSTCNAAATACE